MKHLRKAVRRGGRSASREKMEPAERTTMAALRMATVCALPAEEGSGERVDIRSTISPIEPVTGGRPATGYNQAVTGSIVVVSGQAHSGFAEEICRHLGVPLHPTTFRRFSNDCQYVQIDDNCREQDVFIVQPFSRPVSDHMVELMLMLDAARGASAKRITAVIPYYAYARSDKKDAPRISIAARLFADTLATAGANRVLTMNLHSEQVHGFFSVPVDHLTSMSVMADHFRKTDLSKAIVVSPDFGNAKYASKFARLLGVDVAAGNKKRISDSQVVIDAIVGDVHDKDCIVIDDEIANGGSMFELLCRLREQGARTVRMACTHGLFSLNAIEKLAPPEDVLEVVCTNTIPVDVTHPKLTVLTVAPLFAEAIRRIHSGQSLATMFPNV
jgi:ribose-phosphate pyrophosphokinase